MEMVAGLTGSTACALQAALRLSNEAFAAHVEPACGQVAAWHQKPALPLGSSRPRSGSASPCSHVRPVMPGRAR